MSQQFTLPLGRVRTSLLSGYVMVLAALLLTLMASCAFAQAHVANPFANATFFHNPYYAEEVATAAAGEPNGSFTQEEMLTVENQPTAVWLTSVSSVPGLASAITTALFQQSGTTPIVMTIVIYDLPQRDCSALGAAGELSVAGGDTVAVPGVGTEQLTGSGIQEYENDFITPIYNILAQYKTNPNIRFVLIIEPDSIPNLITNAGHVTSGWILADTDGITSVVGNTAAGNDTTLIAPNCVAANGGVIAEPANSTVNPNSVYVQGIQYALNTFHPLPNVYQYLDVGTSAWLGWSGNMSAAVTFYNTLVTGTTAGYPSIDGFISNTSNYVPTKEPYLTASETAGAGSVATSSFYSYNNYIDEEDYDAALYSSLVSTGFPSTIGFLIDTGRNGWGGTARPTAASTSTDQNTFVNASRIDQRPFRGDWCNINENAGIGALPAVNPGGFSQLQAYVWIKPPGESDGTYPGSTYYSPAEGTGPGSDPNCNPTNILEIGAYQNNLAAETDSLENSPVGGVFWFAHFLQLVSNSYPELPTTAPSLTLYDSSVTLTLPQGGTVTDAILTSVGGYTGNVTLSISGMPSGVNASFSPSPVTAPNPSTLTLTASSTTPTGNYTLLVTGTYNGSSVTTLHIPLTISGFTISASPSTLSIAQGGSSATETITMTPSGGFNGGMSYSINSLPTGVTNTWSGIGNGVTLTLSANSTAPTGSYTITVSASSGSVTEFATFTLNITAAAGFTLSASPSTLSIVQGGSSGTETIALNPTGGFNGGMSYSISSLPTGVTLQASGTPSGIAYTLTASSTDRKSVG